MPTAARPRQPAIDRLLQEARRRFTQDGFAGASLEAMVAACGLTKGALYHHFENKADLFAAVFEEEAKSLCDRVAASIGRQKDPWEAAFAGIRSFLAHSQEPSVQRIIMLDGPSVLGWDRVREIESRYGLALVRGAIEMLRRAGLIAPADPEALAHLLFGALAEGAMVISRSRDRSTAVRVEHSMRQLIAGLALTARR